MSTPPTARRSGPKPISAGSPAFCRSTACAAYAALARRRQQVRLAFCWAHVRRKFFELTRDSPVATEALRPIAALYAIENEVRGLSVEHRRTARAEHSRAISMTFITISTFGAGRSAPRASSAKPSAMR